MVVGCDGGVLIVMVVLWFCDGGFVVIVVGD